MALLIGALDTVRLHLRAGADVNAADDKGRSPLMLAVSRLRRDLCLLLLQEGADPQIQDHQGETPMTLAEAQGWGEMAGLLAEAGRKPAKIPASHADQDLDDPFENFSWETEEEAPPPPGDEASLDEAVARQDRISLHAPLDQDEEWDDVEIDLSSLADLRPRGSRLPVEEDQEIRKLLVQALRDGRTREDLVVRFDPDPARPQDPASGTGLRFLLADFGVEIDDDPEAPDVFLPVEAEDEEMVSDLVSEAMTELRRRRSGASESFALYMGDLPADRLTREEEAELGALMRRGLLEAHEAMAASPAVRSRLQADAAAVLGGQTSAQALFEPMHRDEAGNGGEANGEGEEEDAATQDAGSSALLPASGYVGRLTRLAAACRAHESQPLAEALACAGLAAGYLEELRRLAENDPAEPALQSRVSSGIRKMEAARERLVLANLRLALWIVKRYGGIDLMDRIQEGNLGLMRAAERFDHDRGVKFSTYAVWWIRQSVGRAISDKARTIRLPVHVHDSLRKIGRAREQILEQTGRQPEAEELAGLLEMPLSRVRQLLGCAMEEPEPIDPEASPWILEIPDLETPGPEERVAMIQLEALAREQIASLEEREQEVINRRFGFDGPEQTLEEIGQHYGVTRERIRQIEAKALRKLSHPARLRRWQGFST